MSRSRWPVRALWILTGALTLPAAVTGLLFPEIYQGVVAAELLPGAVSQDLMSAVAGVALPVLAVADRRGRPKLQLVALGVLGYLFYAYGIYSIERTYNGFYLVYLAVFALSFWGMVFTAVELRADGTAAGACCPGGSGSCPPRARSCSRSFFIRCGSPCCCR